MSEKVYAKGLRTFAKHEKAPEWVLGTLIITPNELYSWLKENPQYLTEYNGEKQVKLSILKGKDNKINFVVDTYKKESSESHATITDQEDPF